MAAGDTNERLAKVEICVSLLQTSTSNDAKDVKDTLGKIWDKVNDLPCAVHTEQFKSIQVRINWLYFAFASVVLGGIVFGLWLKINFS